MNVHRQHYHYFLYPRWLVTAYLHRAEKLTVGAFCELFTWCHASSHVFFRMCAYTGMIKLFLNFKLSLLFNIFLLKMCK